MTITKNQGRLSKGDIDRCVKQAEEFKAEEEFQKKRFEARNEYESCLYKLKNLMAEEKYKDKFSANYKQKMNEVLKTHEKWMESHPNASKAEYDAKRKELEQL